MTFYPTGPKCLRLKGVTHIHPATFGALSSIYLLTNAVFCTPQIQKENMQRSYLTKATYLALVERKDSSLDKKAISSALRKMQIIRLEIKHLAVRLVSLKH